MQTTKRVAASALASLLAAFGLLFGLAGTAHAATCSGTYPPTSCSGTVSSSVVGPGGRLSFSASGFQPLESVAADIHSTAVYVGTFQADSTGTVSGTVTVPANEPTGQHELVLTGQRSGAVVSIPFTITRVQAGKAKGLPFTGQNTLAFLAVGAGLVVAGGGTVVAGRLRRHRTSD